MHEDPVARDVGGRESLIAGDVLADRARAVGPEFGGVRFEDLLLVTDDGCETLTSYPYAVALEAG